MIPRHRGTWSCSASITTNTSFELPDAEWPEPVHRSFAHVNRSIYVPMQGPSELGASGILSNWDRTEELE